MAAPPDDEPVPEWVDEDPEMALSMEMDDEELEFDEFAETGGDIGAKAKAESDEPEEYVPLWRLIEMSRENRNLKMELADFEDYDDFESHDGDFAGRLSP